MLLWMTKALATCSDSPPVEARKATWVGYKRHWRASTLVEIVDDRYRLSAVSSWDYGSAGRVGRWRGGLGGAYLLPTLSVVGASVSPPCSVSTLPLIEPDGRISRIRLSDWLRRPAHDALLCLGRDSENIAIFAGK